MRYHVMLADDDMNITQGLKDILTKYFPETFLIHQASSGIELHELLCQYPAALVISDIKMPGMDGLQCLQLIREENLPCEVILLSGYDDYALIRQALKLCVCDYLLKPVHIDSLVQLISELLPCLESRTFCTASQHGKPAAHSTPITYFDIDVQAGLADKELEQCLERFVRGMQSLDAMEAQAGLEAFFAGNDGSVWDEAATKNALVRRVYQLMERIPAMIKVIADNRLTEFDAVSSIKSLPTFSQLRDRLLQTIACDLQLLAKSSEKREQYMISRAKSYITAHCMEELTLEDVALEMHMNPGYFSTLFKQWSGTTFREYLRAERIAQAQKLMLHGQLKLYEIAEQVGYQNASHFNRAFKEVTGASPSMWCLHHRKGDD